MEDKEMKETRIRIQSIVNSGDITSAVKVERIVGLLTQANAREKDLEDRNDKLNLRIVEIASELILEQEKNITLKKQVEDYKDYSSKRCAWKCFEGTLCEEATTKIDNLTTQLQQKEKQLEIAVKGLKSNLNSVDTIIRVDGLTKEMDSALTKEIFHIRDKAQSALEQIEKEGK